MRYWIATLLIIAMAVTAIAATVEQLPVIPGGLRAGDKFPMGRPGVPMAYSATVDQIAQYTMKKYSSSGTSTGTVSIATNTTVGVVKGGGAGITIQPDGTLVATGDGTGDMLKATYDPLGKNANAFARANHTGTQSADTITDGTTNKVYTATEKTKLAAISGTNTGDETQATIKSKLGAATNSVDGYLTATDRAAFAAKQSALTAGVDYLTPTGSAASLTGFPLLNQNTTGTAAGLTAQYMDWSLSSGGASIKNKPTLGTAAAKDIPATGNASATQVVYGTDSRLTDARTPLAHNQDATTITTGTMDGDRLPVMSTTKKGAVPATGTPAGKFLKDDGTWSVVSGGTTIKAASYPSTDDVYGVTAGYVEAAVSNLTYYTSDVNEKGKLAWWDTTTGVLAAYTLPTCTGTDKITSNGTTLSCATDQSTAGSGSMTWPSAAGVANYNGSSGWGTSYSATNQIPFNFLAGVQAAGSYLTTITDSISTVSSTTAASATAVKAAYDLAYGKPSLTSTAPNMDGVASAGTGTTAARVDHVHPTDTSRQAASSELTGLAGLSSTGYVKRTGVGTYTVDNSTFLTGSSPLDATKLSGAIPSTVTATTQTAGDNSAKIATTAYVATAVSAAGGGNVSNSGTPTIHQFGVWTGANNIKGVSVTPSKVMCTDLNGEPVACTNLTDSSSTGMVYPAQGVSVSTGSAWGTSLSATELTGLAGLASNGFVKRTGAGTYTTDTATYLTSESDPKVGSVTSGNYCKGTGTQASCTDTAATVKSAMSLNLVENTALSTWAGSANINTIGTITSGTVPVARIGSLGTGVATALGNTLGGTGGVTTTIASGTIALGTSAIASGTCAAAVTATATGVTTADLPNWSFNSDPTTVTGYTPSTNGVLTIIAFPLAGSVGVRVCNYTAASITPGAITLNWRVWR